MANIDLSELHREVRELRDTHPYIQPDNLFVLWFLKAFIATDEKDAEEALLGGAKDKGIDAIYIDPDARTVHVIQGKYHQGRPSAKLSDVTALADLGRALLQDGRAQFDAAVASASPAVADKLKEVRRRVQRDRFRLHLNFITTGTVSKAAAEDASARLWDWREQADYSASGAPELARLLQDYLQGAAPPIPTIHLEVRPGEVFPRQREGHGMTATVASVDAHSLARMYDTYGVRVFARNIRGFLGMGDSNINRDIAQTLKNEPENFWYFNNGVTIVCDEAKSTSKGGRTILSIKNGQVINGQQTTRVISESQPASAATVLVKIIEIRRATKEEQRRYEKFINQIVKATNWQNPISISDLRTNDDEQVRIEREFRKLNYNYLRRRQTKSESRRTYGGLFKHQIKKEELAQAVAACVLDPYIVRLGKSRLFDDANYHRVFDERSPYEYLVFYWLGRAVTISSRGDPRRSYAKWVVLNQLWHLLSPALGGGAARRALVSVSQHDKKYWREIRLLDLAVNELFECALAFYRSARAEREGKQDESTFFKHSNREQEFRRFLAKSKLSARRMRIATRLDKFVEALGVLAAAA